MNTDTISQRTITVPTEGRQIIVRRMKWKAARAFLKKLAAHIAGSGMNLADALQSLPEIVTKVEELATDLVANSTDLKAEEIDNLDLIENFQVIAAACQLNLGADLKKSCADIMATLGALMPAGKMSIGGESTPSS